MSGSLLQDKRAGVVRSSETRAGFRGLTSLTLSGCGVTDLSVRTICTSLTLLARLDLSYCTYITERCVDALQRHGRLTSVVLAPCCRRLSLDNGKKLFLEASDSRWGMKDTGVFFREK